MKKREIRLIYCFAFYIVLKALVPNLYATVPPVDTHYEDQWNLQKIEIEDAWNISTGNSNVIIAILDNGVHGSHSDLNDNLVQGYDIIGDDTSTNPFDNDKKRDAHGTVVAGIACENGNL